MVPPSVVPSSRRSIQTGGAQRRVLPRRPSALDLPTGSPGKRRRRRCRGAGARPGKPLGTARQLSARVAGITRGKAYKRLRGVADKPEQATRTTRRSTMSALPQEAARPALETVRELASQLRVDSIRCVAAAGSGHPTSSLSAADLMAVLFARHLRYDWNSPDRADNDHLIFSKGHASPLLYAMYKAVGAIDDEELIDDVPQVRDAPRRATRRRPCPGSTWRPARSARACPTASASRWPASGSTSSATASGCSAATARWPRARSGRRSTRRPTTSSTTSSAIVDVNRLGPARTDRARVGHGGLRGGASRRSAAAPWSIDGHDLEADRRRVSRRGARRRLPTVILARTSRARACPRWRTSPAGTASRSERTSPRRPCAELGGVSERRVADAAAAVAAGGGRRRGSAAPSSLPELRDGHEGRDPRGLRRRARGARRPAGGRRHRRRGGQLDLHGEVPRRPTPSASSRCTSPSSRWSAPPWA